MQTSDPLRPPQTNISAFGVTLELFCKADSFSSEDSIWRLHNIYEPFLCANPLPTTGVALDIGAGFGAFALPFAVAFQEWTVVCFEPDREAFDCLKRNIEAYGLNNIIALNLAVGGQAKASAELLQACEGRDDVNISALSEPQPFYRNIDVPDFISPAQGLHENQRGDQEDFATLPATALSAFGADLVKLVAPHCEADILSAIAPTDAGFVVGESWSLPATTALVTAPQRRIHLPIAGGKLALVQSLPTPEQRPGLDVVVALYNARDFIVETVQSLLNQASADTRILVVDDGSTDGSADLIEAEFSGSETVLVLRKPNGGCASARNFGRLHSKATHIAFVDADDLVDPGFFTELLELARYSSAEIVQGGYSTYFAEHNPPERVQSHEAQQFAETPTHSFGARTYSILNAADLVIGQPSIWRRVYRRDFLDSKNIWFPEHIRAFDDQIFQVLSLTYARTIHHMDALHYLYRQHPGQDIKQGDERFFYSLEMFRMIARRALKEGWNDFAPIIVSYLHTVQWIHSTLREDLKPVFTKAAAQLWVFMKHAFPKGSTDVLAVDAFDNIPRFEQTVRVLEARIKGLPDGPAWAYLDTAGFHVPMVRSMQRGEPR